MALFGQQARKEDDGNVALKTEPEPARVPPPPAPLPSVRKTEEKSLAPNRSGASESVLASGLTIEGKIEGEGTVRIAGRFKGQVNAQGEIAIEPGASVEGELIADAVLVGGEVRGQIQAASRVELKPTGSLIGDLKAGSLTVAAGFKMRGKVEFGWTEGEIETVKQAEARLKGR